MNWKKSTAWIVLFLLLFVCPTPVYTLFGSHFDTENRENRTFASKPALTADSFESFPAEYEAYYNDALPFRNRLIRLNNTIQYYLFRQQDINGVVIGKDGWLFYCSEEASNPVNQSLGCWHFTEEQLAQFADAMQNTKDTLEGRGKEFILFIPPNKESIYMEKLPSYYEQQDEYTATDQLVDYLASHTDVTVVYPKEALLDFKAEHPEIQLYLKLDSHWNNAGAYIGARELVRQLGIVMPELTELDFSEITVTGGDLATVMNAPITDVDINYSLGGISGFKTEIIKDDPESELVFSTPGADARRVFIARDSYSIALAPILASQFEDTVFVHHSFFEPGQIEEYDADVYILEIVERNEYQLPQYAVY